MKYLTVAHRCRTGHPDDLLINEDKYTSEMIRRAIYSPHDGLEIDITFYDGQLRVHHANKLPVDPLPIEEALAELTMLTNKKMLFIDCDPKDVQHLDKVIGFLSEKDLYTVQSYISSVFSNIKLVNNVVVHSHLLGPKFLQPSRSRLMTELTTGPKIIYTSLSRDIIDMWINDPGGSIETKPIDR